MKRDYRVSPLGVRVHHAFREDQLNNFVKNINSGADSLQSVSSRVKIIGEMSPKMKEFNTNMIHNSEHVVSSLQSFNSSVTDKAEKCSNLYSQGEGKYSDNLKLLLQRLEDVNIDEGANAVGRAMRPYIGILLVLMLEMLVYQTYLGVVLATYIELPTGFKRYLLGHSVAIFVVFTVSILWLSVAQSKIKREEHRKAAARAGYALQQNRVTRLLASLSPNVRRGMTRLLPKKRLLWKSKAKKRSQRRSRRRISTLSPDSGDVVSRKSPASPTSLSPRSAGKVLRRSATPSRKDAVSYFGRQNTADAGNLAYIEKI